MRRFGLECAVIHPQVDRRRDTCDAALIDLDGSNHKLAELFPWTIICIKTYHIRSFRPRNREFQIGIFLPISKQ